MDGQVPSAIAGSMGKEKKPFTYLPGGLDFSEIRSPKMAKRLAKHQANIAKVGSIAKLTPKVSMVDHVHVELLMIKYHVLLWSGEN